MAYAYYTAGHFHCKADELELLMLACEGHTDGGIASDNTIATCCDADRLDLPRVDLEVNSIFLCTEYAKDPVIKEGARERALMWVRKMAALESLGTIRP